MSEVTHLDARNELLGGFNTFWSSRTAIAAPNRAFDAKLLATTEDAYVRIVMSGAGGGEQRLSNSVERNHFQRAGTIVWEVNVRENIGMDAALGFTEAIASWASNPGMASVMLRSISTPILLGLIDGWWQVTMSAEWVYFTDRAA